MRKRSLLNIIPLGLLCLCTASCYISKSTYAMDPDDPNNPVKEMKISGMKPQYEVVSKGKLEISPKISTEFPDEDLRYEWWAYNELDDKHSSEEKGYRGTLVSESRDLDHNIKEKSGIYRYVLKAISKSTGLSTHLSTKVLVSATNGFFVLKEVDGQTDLDLLLPKNGEMEYLPNRFEALNGKHLSGKPNHVDIIYGQAMTQPDEQDPNKIEKIADHSLAVTRDNGQLSFIRISNFEEVLKYPDELFYEGFAPETFFVERATTGMFDAVIYTDQALYRAGLNNQPGAGAKYFGKFGDANVKNVQPSHVLKGLFGHCFWDKSDKRIKYTDAYFSTATEMPYDGKKEDKEKNDYTATDKVCLFSGAYAKAGSNPTFNFYLLEDEATHERYICRISDRGWSMAYTECKKVDSKTNLAKAEIFGANNGVAIKSVPYLYSIVGNKMYAYNLVTDEEVAVPLEGVPSNETLAYITNIYWNSKERPEENFNYLIVGTQNGDNYTLYFYEQLAGLPYGAPKYKVKGHGKLRSMEYSSSQISKDDEYSFREL